MIEEGILAGIIPKEVWDKRKVTVILREYI
jgi:hypothetical protein